MITRLRVVGVAAVIAGGVALLSYQMSVKRSTDPNRSSQVQEQPAAVGAEPGTLRFPVRMRLNIHTGFPEGAEPTVVTVKFPLTIPGVQSFELADCNTQGFIFFSSHGERYAQRLIKPTEHDFLIDLVGWATRARSYSVFNLQAPRHRPVEAVDPLWLIQDRWVGPYSKEISNIAQDCNVSDAESVSSWAFDICRKRLRYDANNTDVDVREALAKGVGDCSEISDLFVSLCRARGVASRTCVGVTVSSERGAFLHQWAEVFDLRFGWVTVNPVDAMSKSGAYDRVNERLIAFSYERTDPLLYGFPFAGWYRLGGPALDTNFSCEVIFKGE